MPWLALQIELGVTVRLIDSRRIAHYRYAKFGVGTPMRFALVIALGLLVAGCATRANDISAAYVSPIQYQSFTCAQLQEEAARVSSRAAVASGAQDQKANNDAVATGVGVILFWPALFFIKGDAASAQEIAQLKGDMDAIEQANIQKKCGLQFQRPDAAPAPTQ
jgi:hypothetical protein